MTTPTLFIGDITFDANDPPTQARFWAAALLYEIEESGEDLAIAIDPARTRPRLVFQKSSRTKTDKNRIHLDLFAIDKEEEVERLKVLGALVQRQAKDGEVSWTVMTDPEGIEFCVQTRQW